MRLGELQRSVLYTFGRGDVACRQMRGGGSPKQGNTGTRRMCDDARQTDATPTVAPMCLANVLRKARLLGIRFSSCAFRVLHRALVHTQALVAPTEGCASLSSACSRDSRSVGRSTLTVLARKSITDLLCGAEVIWPRTLHTCMHRRHAYYG